MPQSTANTAVGPIEYRLEGEGPTVMILNGGHCSRDTRLSHELLAQQGFSVLTPSRPGYDSTPSSVGRTAQDAADALALLLGTLRIGSVDVVGISAAGPTAIAFAQRHADKTRKLILESAVTLPWNTSTKRRSRLGFGKTESLTWAIMRLLNKFFPMITIHMIMSQLTLLSTNNVLSRMTSEDLLFVRRMIATSRSGTGFMNDLDHVVVNLSDISVPLLAMYSSNDGAVSPQNSTRLQLEIPHCQVFDTHADSHLIWIGANAQEVWERRMAFLHD